VKDTPEIAAARIEVERSRAGVMAIAHEIQERLSPKTLAKGAWEGAKEKGANLAEDAVDVVRSRPLAATGVVAAITMFLAREPLSELAGRIAERLGLEQTDVLEVMEANHNRRPLSLDRPAGAEDSDEAPPSEWVGEEDERFELVEGRIALDAALPYLEERERVVLRLRFVEDMTQSQIAERIGHSQMHVSRILRRALARIRKRIEEERGLDGDRG